jgi:hypothetical protein
VDRWAAQLGGSRDALCRAPLGQLFADHCLALALLDPETPSGMGGGTYEDGLFVLVAPGGNVAMQRAWDRYTTAAAGTVDQEGRPVLQPPGAALLSVYSLLWHLERATGEQWPVDLCARYLDAAEFLGHPLPEAW